MVEVVRSSTSPPPALSEVLPPLILGTAAFNYQYVSDPYSMPSLEIVKRALHLGITAFDTSPYYGPSEVILGNVLRALHESTASTPTPLKREDYMLLTKAGRIAGDEFDYNPRWIRYSVYRSLERLGTKYLDVVYCHDVEFVSSKEVLEALTELRRLRDEGFIRYVGISGYPLDVLCDLADLILRETSEPVDVVMSYAHFTVQNTTLATKGVDRLRKAGVEVVPNASMLGLGLLSAGGIDSGQMKKWHPAPEELKQAMKKVVQAAEEEEVRIETVALSYALGQWGKQGAAIGSRVKGEPLGVSVMGPSKVEEVEETVKLWNKSVSTDPEDQMSNEKVRTLVEERLWPILAEWKDRSWDSPGKGFKNTRSRDEMGLVPDDGIMTKHGG